MPDDSLPEVRRVLGGGRFYGIVETVVFAILVFQKSLYSHRVSKWSSILSY